MNIGLQPAAAEATADTEHWCASDDMSPAPTLTLVA